MKRRLFALAITALLVALAAPASASHTFVGAATSTGLALTVTPPGGEPQGVTFGLTDVRASSAPVEGGCEGDARACARAAGAAEPIGTTATAHAPGNPGPNSSTAFSLPAQLAPILTADVGVAVAQASFTAGTQPDASAQADAGVANLAITLTQTLTQQVPQIQDTLEQVDKALTPVLEADPTGQIGPRVKGVLDQIVANIESSPLATISAGPSSSTVTDTGGVTTATSFARGGVVTLLPTAAPVPGTEGIPGTAEGLAVVEIGAAQATASTDQFLGKAAFDPAIVRLKVYDPTAEGGMTVVEVATGQEKRCAGQAPVVVCVGAGSGQKTEAAAAASAEAQAVVVELFEAPLPKVTLQFAVAAAAVNASPAPPAPVPAADLPRTGGGAALPAVVLAGLGFAGLTLTRVRARHWTRIV